VLPIAFTPEVERFQDAIGVPRLPGRGNGAGQ